MKSREKLMGYLEQARGTAPVSMTEDQLKMELGYQLIQVITPDRPDHETHLPLSFAEFERFFEGATWHFDQGWSSFPEVHVVTNDGIWIKVCFGDALTYEIADAPRANGGWSYVCRSELS